MTQGNYSLNQNKRPEIATLRVQFGSKNNSSGLTTTATLAITKSRGAQVLEHPSPSIHTSIPLYERVQSVSVLTRTQIAYLSVLKDGELPRSLIHGLMDSRFSMTSHLYRVSDQLVKRRLIAKRTTDKESYFKLTSTGKRQLKKEVEFCAEVVR